VNAGGFEIIEDCLFFPHTNLMISIISHHITVEIQRRSAAHIASCEIKHHTF
jgi:hypothetical protein